MKVYYAHPKTWYGTDEEAVDLEVIRERWPEAEIIDPGDPVMEGEFQQWIRDYPEMPYMEFFYEKVREADILVARAFKNNMIGSGVFGEWAHAILYGKETYGFREYDARRPSKLEHIPFSDLVMSIDQTRAYIKAAGM